MTYVDATGESGQITTHSPEDDTSVALPVDAYVAGCELHRAIHGKPVDGCVLCDGAAPVKECCPDLLAGDVCDCEQFAAEAAAVFAMEPIHWDLRSAA